jgi:6-phosphofructokinase 1
MCRSTPCCTGRKSVDVSALYDRRPYRARLMRVEGMPMFLY